MVLETFNEEDFIQNFRMRKETFLYICNQLDLVIKGTDTVMRKSITVKKKVAVTLWFLENTGQYPIYLGLDVVQSVV